MSPDVHSHCEQRRLLFDLPSLNDECDLTAKLEVHWNMHLYSKLQALNAECMSMGLSLYLRKSDSHSGIIAFIGLATAFYELFEQHLRCLNAREDIDIEQVSSSDTFSSNWFEFLQRSPTDGGFGAPVENV
ncbi:hypothetical protein ECG_06110 [Echinococcus granulosus]|nr:hypothetical protein ECG_06110 [Echinococcus granulosus]